MIHLTRLNGVDIVINADLIETLESTPETIVTLTSGRKHTVKESPDQVIGRVVEFRRELVKPIQVQS